ncbi:hypothetical protein [Azospirillum melinis]
MGRHDSATNRPGNPPSTGATARRGRFLRRKRKIQPHRAGFSATQHYLLFLSPFRRFLPKLGPRLYS